MRISNIHIDIKSTSKIEAWVSDKDGDLCPERTDALFDIITDALDTKTAQWGGFQTAGGWWYLEKNYDPRPMESVMRDQLGL